MGKPKIRILSDRDWEHLLIVASGYLPLCEGDLRAAMSRAIAAHQDLILAAHSEAISSELPEGRVTLFVPDGGGLALRLDA